MTVDARIPFVEYTGNGATTKFDWDWYMIEDSSINVLVNNENVFNWSLEDQSVVFDTAPEDGAEIIIYRRTIIWMPEDYLPFGRFHADKTELSVDRAIMIAQEFQGDYTDGNLPNGIVGAANLSLTRAEFDVTVVSERGTDAVLLLYDYDGADAPTPPDPDISIIWEDSGFFPDGTKFYNPLWVGRYSLPDAVSEGSLLLESESALLLESGDKLSLDALPTETTGIAAILRFKMVLDGGDPTEASAYYHNNNAFAYTGWLDGLPVDNEYWMRVRIPGPPTLDLSHVVISDGISFRQPDEIFRMRTEQTSLYETLLDRNSDIVLNRENTYLLPRDSTYAEGTDGPYITVDTYGDTAPFERTLQMFVDICKDDGNGYPDEGWATRYVIWEVRLNA